MSSVLSANNINNNYDANSAKFRHRYARMKHRPVFFKLKQKEHDKLRNPDLITKTKINIENVINTPGYMYRGLKGDPDFNFFEYLRVAKVPYYLGGLGLAAVCLAGRNNISSQAKYANTQMFKKILSGVLMYYVGKEAANAAIDVPVKLFRGIDLNMPYRKITSLREGNPMNLPNNKKQGTQRVFESAEFTRWDLLYKYGDNKNINETFDKLAKKFGAKGIMADSDSRVKGKVRKLIIMANSWKYMLSVPFVTMFLGLAYQNSFADINVRSLWNNLINIIKPSSKPIKLRFIQMGTSLKTNIYKPFKNSFVELWKGNSKVSKIIGSGAIIASIGMAILANTMIMAKTSLKRHSHKVEGGQK